jgi:UDP-N-acetylmuramate: L-alanyl-gamma-D-glutamyl-meso-diaminopimelate ligase
MRIHLIAIGGSAMHNFALALAHTGNKVTGSDDQIFEPSRGRLERAGLLPENEGWDPTRITKDIDVIILGMHARTDNPELLRAKELGLNIQSYPEFLYNQTKNKKRIVIGGSHGKTTITSMLLHSLSNLGVKTDYMVGAQLEGFDRMLELSVENEFAVIEGDEYLSSPIDRRSKFLHYKPHVAIITGISWDHINVFPTLESYIDTFRQFILSMEKEGSLVYCTEDDLLCDLIEESKIVRDDIKYLPYSTPEFTPANEGQGNSIVHHSDGNKIETPLVGSHNYQNLAGARLIVSQIGFKEVDFDSSTSEFTGAARRLEKQLENPGLTVFRDFAHAPSKLKATQAGVTTSYPSRTITAVFELHTFSSLNKNFLPQYKDSMNDVHHAIVFYDPAVVEHKRLPEITPNDVMEAFNRKDLQVITSVSELEAVVNAIVKSSSCVLLMSSGRFGGAEFKF